MVKCICRRFYPQRNIYVAVSILLIVGVVFFQQKYIQTSLNRYVPNIKPNMLWMEERNMTRNNTQPYNDACGDFSDDKFVKRFGKVTTDMAYWKFEIHVDCPVNIIKEIDNSTLRRKLSITCFNNLTSARYSDVPISESVHTMEFGDVCLYNYIRMCCKNDKKVPNIVHYVWYNRGELSFIPFLSLLSVIRFVRPCVVAFHGNAPYGKYWNTFLELWPNVVLLRRDRPDRIFGKKVTFKEHPSDFMRIEALIHYGGIYLDTDTILVKPIESLRKYTCVMSDQSKGELGSAFIMSEKNGTFVQKWMDGYRDRYKPDRYIYNAMIYPKMLAYNDTFHNIIHVEHGTISRPYKMTSKTIYTPGYKNKNWSHVYGMHLYSRLYEGPVNETTIRKMNTIFGAMSRHIYYGNKELCF